MYWSTCWPDFFSYFKVIVCKLEINFFISSHFKIWKLTKSFVRLFSHSSNTSLTVHLPWGFPIFTKGQVGQSLLCSFLYEKKSLLIDHHNFWNCNCMGKKLRGVIIRVPVIKFFQTHKAPNQVWLTFWSTPIESCFSHLIMMIIRKSQGCKNMILYNITSLYLVRGATSFFHVRPVATLFESLHTVFFIHHYWHHWKWDIGNLTSTHFSKL